VDGIAEFGKTVSDSFFAGHGLGDVGKWSGQASAKGNGTNCEA
jgi:hypothetical protein